MLGIISSKKQASDDLVVLSYGIDTSLASRSNDLF
jgi:hypothetical protein